ncbi:MAG: M64 family metallopeptidase [bacterium]
MNLNVKAVEAGEQNRFEKFFLDSTLRIDYVRMGNSTEEAVSLDRLYETPLWAGSTVNLVEINPPGRHLARVFDAQSGELLFLKGFDSIFGEYRTTKPASEGTRRAFQESLLIPIPRAKVRLELESRDQKGEMKKVFEALIDPEDYRIIKKAPPADVRRLNFFISGPPHEKLDILLVADGYRKSDFEKFKADAARFTKVMLKQEPYRKLKNLINIRGVFRPSQESGISEPSYGSHRNSAVGCSFDSLDSNRYILTENNRDLRDIASAAPYDALIILVNTGRYGGGGIYNLYATAVSDNRWADYVFLHEFGHSFAGLGDEYYTSSTSYQDFNPLGVEPSDPNVTALKDPASLKWKSQVSPNLAIPTPWEKEAYDRMDLAYQKVREELNDKVASRKRARAPADELRALENEQDRLSLEHAKKVDAFLRNCRDYGKIGAFEGAGYQPKGLYRPSIDCIMFTKGSKPFCAVCREAVHNRLLWYTEKDMSER